VRADGLEVPLFALLLSLIFAGASFALHVLCPIAALLLVMAARFPGQHRAQLVGGQESRHPTECQSSTAIEQSDVTPSN